MRLPNYLYQYILECIINYKYNRINNIFINNNINSKDYHYGINIEVINYALVNKKFNELVSQLLFIYYSIKKNNELFYYISNPTKPISAHKNIYNYKYKLLKINPINVYNSLKQLKENNNACQNQNIKNIVLIKEDGIDDFKEIINESFENCEFNVSFSIDKYKGDLIYYIKQFKNDGNNKIHLELNGTECKHEKGAESLLKKVMKIQPTSIKHEPNDIYCQELYNHMNYTPYFQDDNGNLKQIHISCTDHVDPFSISKINNKTTQLRSLSCSMLFHDIIRGLNNTSNEIKNGPYSTTSHFYENECDCDYGGLIVEKSISNDWNNMVETLKHNNTIKELSLKNFCYRRNCIENMDITKLTIGLKEILTSPITQIETLELQTIDFIDQVLLDGLENNKTIKNLILMNTSESLVFRYVLSKSNKTIRNVYLTCIQAMNDFLNILKESTNLDLYSITIKFRQLNQQTDIPNFINQYSSISINNNIKINEFNFYSCNNRKFKTIIYNTK